MKTLTIICATLLGLVGCSAAPTDSNDSVKEPFRCTQGVSFEGRTGIFPQAFKVPGKSLEQMIANTWVEECGTAQCDDAGYSSVYQVGKPIYFSLDGTATIPQNFDSADSCSKLSWVYTE